MKPTALFASLALTAGLAAPAFANTIGGITVSDEDWPYVVDYCATLDDLSVSDAADEEPVFEDEVATTTIQLQSLTQADCEAAGLTEEDVGAFDEPVFE